MHLVHVSNSPFVSRLRNNFLLMMATSFVGIFRVSGIQPCFSCALSFPRFLKNILNSCAWFLINEYSLFIHGVMFAHSWCNVACVQDLAWSLLTETGSVPKKMQQCGQASSLSSSSITGMLVTALVCCTFSKMQITLNGLILVFNSFQHYPLYRISDSKCTGEDSVPPDKKDDLFLEKYDVLSQEASQKVCC